MVKKNIFRNRGCTIFSVMILSIVILGLVSIIPSVSVKADTHTHCICCHATAEDSGHTHDLTQEWTATETLPSTAGYYYLTKDVTIGSTWYPADGTFLCLNGHTINGSNINAIRISSGVTFTLTDCQGSGKITGANVVGNVRIDEYGESGGAVLDFGTFNMYAGEISGNGGHWYESSSGMGVDVRTGAVFNMYGGLITDNKVVGWGQGTAVVSSGTFNMLGGEIINTDDYNHYTVYCFPKSTIRLGKNAKICDRDTSERKMYYGLYLIERENEEGIIEGVNVELENPQSGMNIYMTMGIPGVFYKDANETILSYFHSSDPSMVVELVPDEKTGKKNLRLRPHEHDYSFSFDEENSRIIATCQNSDGLHFGEFSLVLSISVNDKVYDGKTVPAPLKDDELNTWEALFKEEPVVSYYKGTQKLDAAPSDAGTYKVIIELASQSFRVEKSFTIAKRTIDTIPTVSVKDVMHGSYNDGDASAHPKNSLNYTAGVKYYIYSSETSETGTEWTASYVNSLASGEYYLNAVLEESDNSFGFSTEKVKFLVNHVHSYDYIKLDEKTLQAVCNSEPSICNEVVETIAFEAEDKVYDGTANFTSNIDVFKALPGCSVTETYKKNGVDCPAPIAVGQYDVTITITKQDESQITLTSSFDITKASVAIPAISGPSEFDYDGTEKSLMFSGLNENVVTVTKQYEAAKNVGEYKVTLSLKDKVSSAWSDESVTDREYSFKIIPKIVKVPKLSNQVYTYDGNPKKVSFTDFDSKYCSVADNSDTQLNAGNYNAVISLKSKENCIWEDNTIEDKTLPYTIERLPIPKPMGDPRTFYCNGSNQTYLVLMNISGRLYDCSGLFYNVSNNIQKNAGTYTVGVTPCANFKWDDGTTNQLSYTFKMNKGTQSYAFVYYLWDKTNEQICGGYDWGTYYFDDRNKENEKVKTFYTPIIYNVFDNAQVTFYVCDNPFKTGDTYQYDNLEFTDLNPGIYYMYAKIEPTADFDGYETGVCPFRVYPYNVMIQSYVVSGSHTETYHTGGKSFLSRVITHTKTVYDYDPTKGRAFYNPSEANVEIKKDVYSRGYAYVAVFYNGKTATFDSSNASRLKAKSTRKSDYVLLGAEDIDVGETQLELGALPTGMDLSGADAMDEVVKNSMTDLLAYDPAGAERPATTCFLPVSEEDVLPENDVIHIEETIVIPEGVEVAIDFGECTVDLTKLDKPLFQVSNGAKMTILCTGEGHVVGTESNTFVKVDDGAELEVYSSDTVREQFIERSDKAKINVGVFFIDDLETGEGKKLI